MNIAFATHFLHASFPKMIQEINIYELIVGEQREQGFNFFRTADVKPLQTFCKTMVSSLLLSWMTHDSSLISRSTLQLNCSKTQLCLFSFMMMKTNVFLISQTRFKDLVLTLIKCQKKTFKSSKSQHILFCNSPAIIYKILFSN